jgi:hypothetical protein
VAQRARILFPYVWPLGEQQRHELEPSYTPVSRLTTGSWRLFLYNCGPEVLREIHTIVDRAKVGYSPFLAMGKFAEVSWQRVPEIKVSTLARDPSRHELSVRFVIARGTREARLDGVLHLDPEQGWTGFDAGDGRSKEIE